MTVSRWACLLIPLVGCVSSRVIRLENTVLRHENEELYERIATLEMRSPDPGGWESAPSLDTVHAFLDQASYVHTYARDSAHIRLEYDGNNADFSVNIQYFPNAKVFFLATRDYLHLDAASDTDSVVLLLVQLAALNYELLLGKFQLNPETGEILLSAEIHVSDGLGLSTLVSVLDHLCESADARFPELERAASGAGL